MTFMRWGMLIGLLTIAIPIIIHLLNRRKIQIIYWGAMEFLLGSLVSRNRRILIEEILVLALRCLLLALLAQAMARPLIPAASTIPWPILLPAVLLGAVALAVGTALWRRREWRWTMYGIAAGLLLLALLASAAEHWIQLRALVGTGGQQDVAIIIDGSNSTTLVVDRKTNFERAVEEAQAVVDALGAADAVSIIVGGPTPRVETPAPIGDRKKIAQILAGIGPGPGSMAVLDALNAAVITLGEGRNSTKKIVVITDGQSIGWDPEDEARWEFLASGLKGLKTAPKVICRTLGMPEHLRNLAISEISLSRDVIGPDRSVGIDVRVENTGDEPVSPLDLTLRVGAATTLTEKVGLLVPGAAETVKFRHRFTDNGYHAIQAGLEGSDELPDDNNDARVISTIDKLPVLIIDGNPAIRPLDRASAFIAIALAPPVHEKEGLGAGGDIDIEEAAGAGGETDDVKDLLGGILEKEGILVEPTIVGVTDVSQDMKFDKYKVVILANVPQLPAHVKLSLEEYVSGGGGVLITLGDRVVANSYNQWTAQDGQPFAGAILGERKTVSDTDEPVRPVLSTLDHQTLMLMADETQSDFGSAAFKSYWKLDAGRVDGATVMGGSLNTGDPLLVDRKLGDGRILTTAIALHADDGTLAGLGTFVPFVHEMVYHLVKRPTGNLNIRPDRELVLRLVPADEALASGSHSGLRGDYYTGVNHEQIVTTRIDPTINFNWGTGAPIKGVAVDNFSVRWTGSIIPRYSETYTFVIASDDQATLWVGNRQVVGPVSRGSGTIDLEADMKYRIRLDMVEKGGHAAATLSWSSSSQPQEIVPADRLAPDSPWQQLLEIGQVAQMVGSDDEKRVVRIAAENDVLAVHVGGTAKPGLYRLRLPEFLKDSFGYLYDREGTIPFAVTSSAAEGRLAVLTPGEIERIDSHVKFFRPESTDQLVAILVGDVPGQELWKYLATAALAVLLAESFLTRWIALQRKTASTQTVGFASRAQDPAAFRARARELLGADKSA